MKSDYCEPCRMKAIVCNKTGSHQNALRALERIATSLLGACMAALMCEGPGATVAAGAVSAMKTGDKIIIESMGGAVSYKAVVDAKSGGDITELNLPADGNVIARNVGDIFYFGT